MRINTGTEYVGLGWKPLVRVLNEVLIGIDDTATVEVNSAQGFLDYRYTAGSGTPNQDERDLFARLVRGVQLVALSTCEMCGEEGFLGTPMVDGKNAMTYSTVLCTAHRIDQVNRIKDARSYA